MRCRWSKGTTSIVFAHRVLDFLAARPEVSVSWLASSRLYFCNYQLSDLLCLTARSLKPFLELVTKIQIVALHFVLVANWSRWSVTNVSVRLYWNTQSITQIGPSNVECHYKWHLWLSWRLLKSWRYYSKLSKVNGNSHDHFQHLKDLHLPIVQPKHFTRCKLGLLRSQKV